MSNDHDDDRMITTINHDARRPTQHSGGHSRLSDILPNLCQSTEYGWKPAHWLHQHLVLEMIMSSCVQATNERPTGPLSHHLGSVSC